MILFGTLAVPVALIAGFIFWRVNLGRDVEGRLAKIAAAGLPTRASENDRWYPALPHASNAAVLMGESFQLLHTFPDTRSNTIETLKLPARSQPLDSNQVALLTSYVEMNGAALSRARLAVRNPSARYPINLSAGYATLLPHLAKLKRLGRLFQFEARLTDQLHRKTSVVQSLTPILGLAHTLDSEPLLISQLVRAALISMAVERFRLSTGKFPESLTALSPNYLPKVPLDPFDGMPLPFSCHFSFVTKPVVAGASSPGKSSISLATTPVQPV